ncbi:hypothetical protein JKP88DRAFT_233527 [Tribonema minus]|uniref:Uncharacterized protein n=1 Tax=Tribonema minus TaxID=303371 RepID=A0A835ZHX6_9STRA|nr:hypothetical protein JKP88DRAFT_233527 [Tribonema minus]
MRKLMLPPCPPPFHCVQTWAPQTCRRAAISMYVFLSHVLTACVLWPPCPGVRSYNENSSLWPDLGYAHAGYLPNLHTVSKKAPCPSQMPPALPQSSVAVSTHHWFPFPHNFVQPSMRQRRGSSLEPLCALTLTPAAAAAEASRAWGPDNCRRSGRRPRRPTLECSSC